MSSRGSFVIFAAAMLSACSGSTPNAVSPPPSSAAVIWNVTAGAESHKQAFQGLQYYPNAITIDAGDTITWHFPAGEPHTVSLLGGGTKAYPPPTDPNAQKPAGGVIYDGSAYTSSGFVLLGKTYSLTFTKPGTYTYQCLLHPGMSGTIVVQPQGAPYPNAQSVYDSQAAARIKADLAQAAAAVAEFPFAAGGTQLAAGISAGLSGARSSSTVVRFLDGPSLKDGTVRVKVGTTITWTNLSSNSPHTVTFGVVGQAFPSLPPFSPPAGGPTYDGSTFTNSGVMMPGQKYSLTFTKAGTYVAHCLFHDDAQGMIANVIVK